MTKLGGKWEGVEEFNRPKLMIVPLSLSGDLLVLGVLTKAIVPM